MPQPDVNVSRWRTVIGRRCLVVWLSGASGGASGTFQISSNICVLTGRSREIHRERLRATNSHEANFEAPAGSSRRAMTHARLTDERLAILAGAGDERALELLYERHSGA